MRTRTLAIILGISVALNLFFLGVVAARAWQRHEARLHRPAHGPMSAGPRRPRPRTEPFQWLSEAERDELRPRRKALRGLRREAEAALRAEPFDGQRLRGALGALRQETDAIQAAVHELMIRQAGAMSVDERRRLADSEWGRDDAR